MKKLRMSIFVAVCTLSVGCADSAVMPVPPVIPTAITNVSGSVPNRAKQPQVEVLDGGRVIILRGAAVDTAIGTLSAFYSAAGASMAQVPLSGPSETRYASPSGPNFEVITGEQVTAAMFPTASISAHSTVPSLDAGATAASINSSANYTGSNAHLDMLWGASRDDNGIEKPQTSAEADDDAFWDCVGAILSTPNPFDFSAKCSASGTVKQKVLYTTSTSCGVHVYGSANYQAWYWAPLPDPSGSLSSTGGGVTVHFSMAKIHPSPIVGDPQTEAYNGSCEDDGPTDEYSPGSGGSESGGACPEEDTYMWYHDYQDGRGLVYVGDVCIQNGIITLISSRDPDGPTVGRQLNFDVTPRKPAEGLGAGKLIVALVDTLPASASARIFRSGAIQVIALGSAATPKDLTLAVGTLGLLRALNVMQADMELTPTRHGTLLSGDATSRLLEEMTQHIDELKRATPMAVPLIGTVPAIEIPITGQARMKN